MVHKKRLYHRNFPMHCPLKLIHVLPKLRSCLHRLASVPVELLCSLWLWQKHYTSILTKTQEKLQTQPSIILFYILLLSFLFLLSKRDSVILSSPLFIILWFAYLKDKFQAKTEGEVNMFWIYRVYNLLLLALLTRQLPRNFRGNHRHSRLLGS